MVKYFCDWCNAKIEESAELSLCTEKVRYNVGVRVELNVVLTHKTPAHICKSCILDLVAKIDDRPRQEDMDAKSLVLAERAACVATIRRMGSKGVHADIGTMLDKVADHLSSFRGRGIAPEDISVQEGRVL